VAGLIGSGLIGSELIGSKTVGSGSRGAKVNPKNQEAIFDAAHRVAEHCEVHKVGLGAFDEHFAFGTLHGRHGTAFHCLRPLLVALDHGLDIERIAHPARISAGVSAGEKLSGGPNSGQCDQRHPLVSFNSSPIVINCAPSEGIVDARTHEMTPDVGSVT
jgi:hypothetical protein